MGSSSNAKRDIEAVIAMTIKPRVTVSASQRTTLGSLRKLFSGNIVGLWMMDDVTTVCKDYSGNNYDGEHSATDLVLQDTIGPWGRSCVYYPGVNNRFTNLYSAGLAASYPNSAGSLIHVCRVSAVAEWTDGVSRHTFDLRGATDNDRTRNFKSSSNLEWQARYGSATSGGARVIQKLRHNATDWMVWSTTWSVANNEMLMYYEQNKHGNIGTIVAWSGGLSVARIGDSIFGTQPWKGWIGPVILLDKVATQDEIEIASRVLLTKGSFSLSGMTINSEFDGAMLKELTSW